MTQYLVGYYKPSLEFTRIPEFMGIFDRQGTLIGITGPSTSRQAALDARLFAAAPDLLNALKTVCQSVSDSIDPSSMLDFPRYNELTHTLQQAAHLLEMLEPNAALHN